MVYGSGGAGDADAGGNGMGMGASMGVVVIGVGVFVVVSGGRADERTELEEWVACAIAVEAPGMRLDMFGGVACGDGVWRCGAVGGREGWGCRGRGNGECECGEVCGCWGAM